MFIKEKHKIKVMSWIKIILFILLYNHLDFLQDLQEVKLHLVCHSQG